MMLQGRLVGHPVYVDLCLSVLAVSHFEGVMQEGGFTFTQLCKL